MARGECYLFLGPEIGEKQDAIDEIKRRLFPSTASVGTPAASVGAPSLSDVEQTTFYAGDVPFADISAFISTGSLFSAARIISIKNADALKKNEAESLAALAAAPLENTLLFITSDETKVEKALEQAFDGRTRKVFWELFESRKPQWVKNFWRREGFTISDGAVEALLEMVENNTDALRRECSRLMLFLKGERKEGRPADLTVDAETVEKHLSHNRAESAFTLFSAIAAGDMGKSLEIMRALIAAQESPAAIFAGLMWCYHKFHDYCLLNEKGLAGSDFELKKAGISVKAVKDYALALKVYGKGAAGKFISLTAGFDLALRAEGGPLKEVLTDWYIYRVMRAAV